MIGDHQNAARLERGEQLAVHLGAIDRHVGRVVVVEEEGDEVQIARIGRQRVVERPRQHDDVLHRRGLHARLDPLLRPAAEVGRVLPIDLAARARCARHQLGAVAAACAHIEHLHARAHAGEGKELHRIAALVGLAVGVAAVGRSHDGGVVGHGLRPRRRSEQPGKERDGGENADRGGSVRALVRRRHVESELRVHSRFLRGWRMHSALRTCCYFRSGW